MADTHIKIKPVTPRVQYTANGSTTVFPYSFAIFDETDMVVYVDDTIITTGYTVSGAGQTDGGNVTFDSAPEDGKKITLLRNVPIERMTDFQEGGTFRPKNINDEFDRQTAFMQQVQEKVDRTLILPPTTDIDPSQILGEVERIYDSIDNVDAVADNKTNINNVAGDLTNIDAVAANESNINTVAGISSDVSTVAGNTTDISNVATNMSDVNDCATNIEAIQAAPTAATNAAASAEQAAISAAGTRFKLFHHDWFDYQLNDMAWLRADTFSWQDGTVYTEAYNHLVADYNDGTSQTETVGSYTITYVLAADGHKITTDETTVANIYNESGVAWYYILDTANQRFKLPRENPAREVLGQSAPVIFKDSQLKLGTGLNNGNVILRISNYDGSSYSEVLGPSGAGTSQAFNYSGNYSEYNVRTNLSETTGVYKGKQYLYFYVGQFNQSATEQTAGLNSELFNRKLDIDASNATASAVNTLVNKANSETKGTIVGWGCPDYTRQISVSLPYTATSDGIFFFKGTNSGNVTNKFKIDNLEFWFNGYGAPSGGNIPMKKGQQISWVSGNLGSPTYTFVPYSGE